MTKTHLPGWRSPRRTLCGRTIADMVRRLPRAARAGDLLTTDPDKATCGGCRRVASGNVRKGRASGPAEPPPVKSCPDCHRVYAPAMGACPECTE